MEKKYKKSKEISIIVTKCFLGNTNNISIGESLEDNKEISFIPFFSSLSSFLLDSPFSIHQKEKNLYEFFF